MVYTDRVHCFVLAHCMRTSKHSGKFTICMKYKNNTGKKSYVSIKENRNVIWSQKSDYDQ